MIESNMGEFISQIKEIGRLEKDSNELYRFARECCNEIYKYTGDNLWRDKLDAIVGNHSGRKVRRSWDYEI